jgi:serine/threonine protein phosphatase PrpC
VKLHVTTFAQPGKRDSESQDRLGVTHFEDGSVLCVLSDGVGSGRDPGRCAERVVKLVSDSFSARPKKWPIQKVLRQLVDQINESLYKEGAYLDGTASMQATLSIVALVENRMHGLNIGDSPVYLVHDSKMELMSEPHVTKRSEGQRALTQAVGMGPTLRPHEFERGLGIGDVILLASDGVTDLLKTELALESILKQAGTARTVVQSALEKTKDSETDDLSAILINVQALGPAKQMHSVASSFRTPELGEVIEGYTLVKDLSPNGRVWLAESESGAKRVVIKFIPQEAETDDSGVTAARFAREAWNASRITGPEFVPAWLPSDGSDRYFLMEYVDSPSVAKLIESRRLTLEETVSLGRFLCNAGQSLLSHELLHCDI